jgi:hypothetical protein
MSVHRRITQGALAAVAIEGRTMFTWFGLREDGLPAATETAMSDADARAYLVYQLQTRLYGSFYTQGEAKPALADAQASPTIGPSAFMQALSDANHGSGSLESGWKVVAREDGRLVVERAGLRLWAAPESVAANGNGAAVRMPKELLRLSPGYYMALGNRELPTDGSEPIVRFYWNLHSEGAAALVDVLTRRLNEAQHAFRLKVASEPPSYTRCDAGVLYTLCSEYNTVVAVVANVHRELALALKPATPAYTKPLAPGLGLAEDPSGGTESFGQSRCQLLAEAIVDGAGNVDAVAERFAQAGIDLDRPYLNPGSADVYTWPA